jgi:hypothetical protein
MSKKVLSYEQEGASLESRQVLFYEQEGACLESRRCLATRQVLLQGKKLFQDKS